MRGAGTNHQGKLGLKRILCGSQFTIPNTAGMSPDPACNSPRRGILNPIRQVGPLRSHTHLHSPHCSHFYPPSLCISSTTLPSSLNTKLSHSSLSLHAMIISWDRVQAYAEYSIHRVQHTLRTATTQECLSSLHSHDYRLTPECSFSFRHASIHNRPPSASSPSELKAKVTLSHSQGSELTN